MPKPLKGETKQQFMARFMSDSAMRKKYPDQKQLAAVANAYWRDHLNSGSTSATTDFTLTATFLPGNIQGAKPDGADPTVQRFHMTLYSGAPMRPRGYREDVVLDLSTLEVPKSINVLADHQNNTDNVVGQGQPMIVNNTLIVAGTTTEATTGGKRVTRLLREQQPLQASVGCDQIKVRRLSRDETINGRRIKAGTLVTVRARLREGTVTPCGGDNNTSVLAATRQKENQMGLNEFLAALGLDVENLSDEDKTKWEATYNLLSDEQRTSFIAMYNPSDDDSGAGNSSLTANGSAVDAILGGLMSGNQDNQGGDNSQGNQGDTAQASADQGDRMAQHQNVTPEELRNQMLAGFRQDVSTDRERIGALDTLVAEYSDRIDDQSELSTLQATAVRDGWAADRLELALRRMARPDISRFAIPGGGGGQGAPSTPEVVEASLLLNCGMLAHDQVQGMFGDNVMEAATSHRFQNYGLKRLCHEVITAAGMYYAPATYDNGFIHSMMEADRRLNPYTIESAVSMGGISTVSVSGILSNVMHKLLLQSFTGDSNGLAVLNQISSVRPVSDFKDNFIYRLTADGEYHRMPPGGNLEYMSLQEEENKIRAHTYGVMMALNREMVINDDLNAFAKVPMLIGRQARMKYLKIGYKVFLDDANFYTTARGNLIENTPFDIDGLTAVVPLWRKIRDLNGDPIDTNPRFVVLPSKHEVQGDVIYRDTNTMVYNQDTSATAVTVGTVMNPHKGKYQPYATSWLDATKPLVPGGDDDAWYICAAESDMLPLQRAFLNGNQTPRIERVELPADKLGIGWRSYFDFGFARQEWRGSMKILAGPATFVASDSVEVAADEAPKPKPTRRGTSNK